MIALEVAVKTAKDEIQKLYLNEDIKNFLLEEAELSEDSGEWFITVGFDIYKESKNKTLKALHQITNNYERLYKIVKIDSNTGIFKGFKIREL